MSHRIVPLIATWYNFEPHRGDHHRLERLWQKTVPTIIFTNESKLEGEKKVAGTWSGGKVGGLAKRTPFIISVLRFSRSISSVTSGRQVTSLSQLGSHNTWNQLALKRIFKIFNIEAGGKEGRNGKFVRRTSVPSMKHWLTAKWVYTHMGGITLFGMSMLR